MNPQTARPQERTFKNPDVVQHAMEIRETVLRDVIGIIAGYIASATKMPTACRFARWDHMVRQPIIWADGEDIAQIFRDNAANSATNGAAVALLLSLQERFGSNEFSSGNVAGIMALLHLGDSTGPNDILREALVAMRSKDPKSDASVGRVFHSIVNKRVETQQGELVLKHRLLNGLSRYRVA